MPVILLTDEEVERNQEMLNEIGDMFSEMADDLQVIFGGDKADTGSERRAA
jgi:hypothetical protein